MPNFFFGKFLCATYPQANELSKDILLAFFQNKFDLSYMCVSEELHQDGNRHYHVAAKFLQKTRLSATSCDVNNHHPNLQPAKKWMAWLTYVKKDGNFLEVGENRTGEQVTSPSQVCLSYDSYVEWLDYCIAKKISHAMAKELWDLTHFDDLHTIGADVDVPAERITFEFEWDWKDGRSLILEGDTGCGKTSWAKKNAPKPALFVRHVDTLGDFRPGVHASIIFDDLSFVHQPRSQQLFFVDTTDVATLHIRYKRAVIPAGIPRVFTCNPGYLPVAVDDPAIRRRVKVVRIRSLE